MKIGEFSRCFGISAQTIRNYEARGLVKPARDRAGHRKFSEADVRALLKNLRLMGNAENR